VPANAGVAPAIAIMSSAPTIATTLSRRSLRRVPDR
jgi:hypothetical protein